MDWLDRSEVDNDFDESVKYLRRAEALKSLGLPNSKRLALESAERAVAAARRALEEPEVVDPEEARLHYLACLHDRARIRHYLFGDLEGAEVAYREVIAEWRHAPRLGPQLGIAQRNLAECLESRRRGGVPVDPAEVNALVVGAAREVGDRFPDAPVLCEIRYTQGKLAERRGDPDATRIFRQAWAEADRAGNYMLRAIIDSRSFWHFEPYRPGRWPEIEAMLAAFPDHGFAVRVLMDGRLRFARAEQNAGRPETALAALKANLDTISRHPSFDGGSDRERIAATFAGLAVMGRLLGRPDAEDDWRAFIRDHPWAAEFLSLRGWASPDDAWTGGTA
jgi:hypothetical protein